MTTIDEQKKLVDTLCHTILSRPRKPISQMQAESSRDTPARGGVWISRTSFVAPKETSLRDTLYHVCERLKTSEQSFIPRHELPLRDVGVEFIGPRSNVDGKTPEPDISELDKLAALENECRGNMTILYFHGGGLYTSSPTEYRASSARLARLTNARVASVRYRLAPANTFPTPILDALVAYTSLMYPPPGSHHKPVPANRIVLAGNSSGGNLCFALTRFLLEIKRKANQTSQPDPRLLFHGIEVQLPVPAGIATCSSWCDQCDALPSWLEGGDHDILGILQPALQPGYPTDELWPSEPPREHPYCVAATLDHELVSPAAVRDWTGAPPMWFACGSEERGLDGNKVVASQAAKSGVPVIWNEYAGMPHEFMIMMGKLPQAFHCLNAWAEMCVAFANRRSIKSRGRIFNMPNCGEVEADDVVDLAPLPFDEVRRRMKRKNGERPVWTGVAATWTRLKSNV